MRQTVNQWCRVVMNNDLTERVEKMNPATLDALEVSGSVWASMGFKSYSQAIYPQFDICSHRLPEAKFDIAIAEQVFEHIPAPQMAAENILQSLRPGGAFVISTPFLIMEHPSPLDMWR